MEYVDELISDLIFFIDTHPTFDGSYIDSIVDDYERDEKITPKQYETLVKIHQEWRVCEYVMNKKQVYYD